MIKLIKWVTTFSVIQKYRDNCDQYQADIMDISRYYRSYSLALPAKLCQSRQSLLHTEFMKGF